MIDLEKMRRGAEMVIRGREAASSIKGNPYQVAKDNLTLCDEVERLRGMLLMYLHWHGAGPDAPKNVGEYAARYGNEAVENIEAIIEAALKEE